MWRSSAQSTGSNVAPLGATRRWGDTTYESSSSSSAPAPANNNSPASASASESPQPDRERRRKSRWGSAPDKSKQPSNVVTAINSNVKPEDLDRYAIRYRLDEISQKLRSGDIIPAERERSPSPPPQYDNQGRRTNTREVRYRKKLEDERNRLVERAMKIDPNFKPPQEYLVQKRTGRSQEKVYIPTKEFPEINFFGLLVGPRGNSLKKMEGESGAKISIRGKGSVKEGKGRPDYGGDEDEDLHCLITADSDAKVQKCIQLINKVIETAASTPETQNDHKRNQLRELAQLNGTLRDDENQICQNCGQSGHKKYDCPQQQNFTANIFCRNCGGAGHMARDCKSRPNSNYNNSNSPDGNNEYTSNNGPAASAGQFDSEYASLMAELGEGPAQDDDNSASAGKAGSATPGLDHQSSATPKTPGVSRMSNDPSLPPWRNPANWQPAQPPTQKQYNPYRNHHHHHHHNNNSHHHQHQYHGHQQHHHQQQHHQHYNQSYYNPQQYSSYYQQT